MDTKAKQAKNEYYKEYRRRNKERIKSINDRYWAKRAEQGRQEGEKSK